VTVPPQGWFHGIAGALYDRYRRALADLGVALFDVPVDAFLAPDAGRLAALISELRSFRPQFAMGLPLGAYALLCRLPARRDGYRPNVFIDLLDIPTICLWDHAPVELADQILAPLPLDPASSAGGALQTLRAVLAHPRLVHWSRDTGQTAIMRELGLLPPHPLVTELPPMLPGFERVLAPTHEHHPSVAFIGHLYQQPVEHPHAALAALAEEATLAHVRTPREPLWGVLRRLIAALPAADATLLSLDADRTFFWRFAHRLICHQAQTTVRLTRLGAAGVPVACYGNLDTAAPSVPANLRAVPSNVPYGPSLAHLFARHPITIDVLNPGFINGYSHKQVHGFASGGFMLLDWKQDFVDAFGDAGAAVSFLDGDDLAAKVDLFLSKPQYRVEVGDAIRATIASRFQLNDCLSRALEQAWQCADVSASAGGRRVASPWREDEQPVLLADLTGSVVSAPAWLGASVQPDERGLVIATAVQPWAYAAQIMVPDVRTMHEPCVRLSLMVEQGRFGVAALHDESGALLDEQYVSPTTRPFLLTVELPQLGYTSVILRNASDGVSRAVLLQAALCDRPNRLHQDADDVGARDDERLLRLEVPDEQRGIGGGDHP
jgi:hypothetical protein